MEVRILGPLEVSVDGRPLPIGGYRQRLVLGVLLVRPHREVSADWLIDAVWGERPPRTARKTLQVYISRLRRILGGQVIAASPTGYTLRLVRDQLDAARFEQLATEGHRLLTVDPAAAARVLHEALSMWRGVPWGDLGDESAIQPEAQRLRERRLEALEDRITADLETGRAAGLVGELEGLVDEHPWRERFRSQLMLALYRAGRQADALHAFQTTQAFFGEELGIEPSPELQDLEEQILLQDPTLTGPEPAAEADDWKLARNPYKGLRPFRRDDHEDFFGRSALIDELLDRTERHRFVAVTGASGSGKSSVVLAGLVPQLPPEGWIIATMVPGGDPFRALEAALEEARPAPHQMREVWRGDELDLVRAVQALVADDGHRLLLVIDQFEELLHQVTDDATRARFTRNLAEAVEDPTTPLTVLITLRADFLHKALEQSPLGELIGTNLVSVRPLRAHELEAAAVSPAQRAGVHMEPELIAELVADMTDQPGALPLFQYVLTQLFDERRGPVLTRSAYRRLGGLTGALSRRAEEVYGALGPPARAVAHQVFMRLVTVDAAGIAGRRRMERASLESLDPPGTTIKEVLAGFDAARLLTFDRHPITAQATVEVAHEALLHEWPRMQRWLETAREDLRLHGALMAEVGEWDAAGRDPDYLLTGSRLDLYQDWGATTALDLTEPESAFLAASASRREAEGAEEEARRTEELRVERRSVRRLRALVVVVSIAALIAAGLTFFAANRNNAAQASQREARARELANASLVNLEGDAELALLLAIEALEVTRSVDGFVVGEAVMALHQAVSGSRLVATHRGEWDLEFDRDGNLFTGGPEAALFDPMTGESARALSHPEDGKDIESVAVSPDGRWLAAGSNPGGTGQADLVVWDAASGAEMHRIRADRDTIGALAFSPDSRLLASLSPWGGGVKVWDVVTGDQVAHGYDSDAWADCCPPVHLAFSPNGSSVAAGTMTGEVLVLDVTANEWAAPIVGHEAAVTTIRFLPDGNLVTSSWDETVRMWSGTGEPLVTIEAGVGFVNTIAVSDDGRFLMAGGNTGTVRLWAMHSGRTELVATLSGHRSPVFGVAFDPRGVLGASVSLDGEVRVWDVSPSGRGEIAAWPGDGPLAFSPDGALVAVADTGQRHVTVRPTQGGPPQLVLPVAPQMGDPEANGEWGLAGGIAFSPDGRSLATTDFAWQQLMGSLTLWDTTSGDELRTLFQHRFLRGGPIVSRDGGRIAVGTCTFPNWSSTATVVDSGTGDVVFATPPGPCGHAVDLDPAGELLAVQTENDTGNVQIWAIATGELVAQMSHHPSMLGAVQFSPDGTRVLTAGIDGFGRIWGAESGNHLLSLEGHTGPVHQGIWVSDETVATVGGDSMARIWDARTGEALLTLQLEGEFATIAVSSDGNRLATVSGGNVRIWTLDLDELLDIATARLSRALSPAECVTFHFDDCPGPL